MTAGSSLAVDFRVAPGQENLAGHSAWYAPEWEGNGVPGTGGRRIETYAPEVPGASTTGNASRICTRRALPMRAR